MKIGVIRFPGSNCDRDVYQVIKSVGGEVEYVWWNEDNLNYLDGIVIPGGFSYGDYLRAGAIASITPVLEGIKSLVKEEKPVLGICNGAQILAEVGLVPGIFTVNENSKFICQWENLKVKTNRTPFTKNYKKSEIIKMPIAHSEGRYFNQSIELLKDQDQIVLQFTENNPNGSLNGITGVCDESGLICAIMPHPERASNKLLGSDHGLNFFKGML
ncbi:MAG: phosphoribosylformylglycinamidine synthase subunit PurQ [Methanobrevibacter sp.]|jgi:phosphoribosylformylglycinamidine synthase|nr:phosphoribosylformylglycinamidine synthase subunit PurQ [Candidatus Methanovirga basalitermitum]